MYLPLIMYNFVKINNLVEFCVLNNILCFYNEIPGFLLQLDQKKSSKYDEVSQNTKLLFHQKVPVRCYKFAKEGVFHVSILNCAILLMLDFDFR